MAAPRKPKKGKARSGTALDSEQKELDEQGRQLREKIDALQRTINEHRIEAAVMTDGRPARRETTAVGKRTGAKPERPVVRKNAVLRREKQEGRLQTLVLAILVIVGILWALSRWM